MVAQLLSHGRTVGELRGVEAGDVAGEVEVLLGPLANRGQPRTEQVRDDVVGLTDEDRPVAHPRVALDLLDHLAVVVGGHACLSFASGRHRQPPDEVGHPGERCALQLRVLMPEVVGVPCLVADDEVVVPVLDDIVKHMEVGDEDLVHSSPCLEAVQVVLGRLFLDVGRLTGEPRRRRMDTLAAGIEHGGDRVLGEPVDLYVGVQGTQLARDRHVAQSVSEADR